MPNFLLPLLLLTTAPAHAAWLHLCPQGGAPGPIQAGITRPDGSQAQIVASDQPQPTGCTSLALGVDLRQVEAIHPLPAGSTVGHTILLQGGAGKPFMVNDVTLPPATPAPEPPAPMPMHANLLAAMQVRPFGVEERIRTSLDGGRLHIDCAPGDRPAGVLLAGPWYLPRANTALQLAFSGSGSFRWQAADAGLAARGGALELGSIDASGMPGSARLQLPSGLDRSTWRQFALACPDKAATLVLESLALVPAGGKVPRRSTWAWQSGDWRDSTALLDWAHRTRVGEVFIVVPTTGARVRDTAALAAFVRKAHRAGVAVWTVDGDPRMVLPSERTATVARARAYAAYNAGVEPAARLAGMQFDVEPYLLPGYDADAGDWDRRYLELAAALRQAARTLRLEFVVPYWWSRKEALLRDLATHADGLCVMDYRTAPDEIYRFAVPFLDWAEQYGKRARIALEAGAVAPEVQRRYQRLGAGAAGNLALVRIEGQPVLVLLREAHPVPDGEAFRLIATRDIDGSATTFHGWDDELLRLLPQIEQDFSAWRGFAGVALHEVRPGTSRIQP